MSNISTAYDAIRTMIGTTLSTHTELSNPYFVDKDSDLNFTTAWTLGFGAGTNTKRNLNCKLSVQQDLVFVVTRKIFKTTHRTIDVRIETEKSLFEDWTLVISEIESNPTLGSSSISKLEWVQHNGIEFIRSDRTDLIMIQTIISLDYFENLN